MESELSLSEEHKCDSHSQYQSIISEITFRGVSSQDVSFSDVLTLFESSWREVNDTDLSQVRTESNISFKESELAFHMYLKNGVRFQAAFLGNQAVGILVYSPVFDGVLAVRMLYLKKDYRLGAIGQGLIISVLGLKGNLIFQTHKRRPPELMLKLTEGYRSELFQDENLITWMMPWRA